MFATLPVSCLLPLSEEILDNDTHIKCCAALCSGSAAFRALRDAQTQPGDVLLVVGVAGGIGHLVGTMAKNTLGLRVIGVDKQSKIESLTAEQAGRIAHVLIPAPEEDINGQAGSCRFKATLLEACTSLRGGIGVSRGAETAIVAASEIGAFRHLEDYVCDGGQVICLG
jgi:alcohol dehydrogenase, propanol-preferring